MSEYLHVKDPDYERCFYCCGEWPCGNGARGYFEWANQEFREKMEERKKNEERKLSAALIELEDIGAKETVLYEKIEWLLEDTRKFSGTASSTVTIQVEEFLTAIETLWKFQQEKGYHHNGNERVSAKGGINGGLPGRHRGSVPGRPAGVPDPGSLRRSR